MWSFFLNLGSFISTTPVKKKYNYKMNHNVVTEIQITIETRTLSTLYLDVPAIYAGVSQRIRRKTITFLLFI